MRAVLLIFVVCLIGKDLAYAPFPYVLRGAAQGLCLLAGFIAIIPYLSANVVARYWPVLGYVATLLITVPFSRFPLFTLLQVASLLSAIVFFIGYFERQRLRGNLNLGPLAYAIVAVYGVACLLGLIMIKLRPDVAYGALNAGTWVGEELRFRGLFSKSGMMGAASGLLVGFAAIQLRRMPTKLITVAIAATCLLLTQSRSFWIAAIVAGFATMWRYYPKLRSIAIAMLIGGAMMGAIFSELGLRIDTANAAKFARLDTVATFTGRTQLWNDAINGLRQRPWFGYGFTLGSTGLAANKRILNDEDSQLDPTNLSRQTLHNGYVQCALDAGLVGLFFYCATMLIALRRLIGCDRARQFPVALYGLIFLMVANSGESVIYSGSIFQSLCFWAIAIFSLGLVGRRREASKPKSATQKHAPPLLRSSMA